VLRAGLQRVGNMRLPTLTIARGRAIPKVHRSWKDMGNSLRLRRQRSWRYAIFVDDGSAAEEGCRHQLEAILLSQPDLRLVHLHVFAVEDAKLRRSLDHQIANDDLDA
jgi:hypothetical protein